MRKVCVFCGSNRGNGDAYAEAARATGLALVQRGIELVYGGGSVGLMGIISDTVMAAGGRVTGIIPERLWSREIGNTEVTDLRVVGSMHERKTMMAEMSDGFIALPGGFGTFEEFCEAITWTQLGLHDKPCGLLNVEGYYDSLLGLFERAERDGFLRGGQREVVLAETDPRALLDRMKDHRPPSTEDWLGEAAET